MMQAAGLSIAYHPKPAVAQVAMVSIFEGGLDRALEVFTPAGSLAATP
jgi:phosphoserine phosphatase